MSSSDCWANLKSFDCPFTVQQNIHFSKIFQNNFYLGYLGTFSRLILITEQAVVFQIVILDLNYRGGHCSLYIITHFFCCFPSDSRRNLALTSLVSESFSRISWLFFCFVSFCFQSNFWGLSVKTIFLSWDLYSLCFCSVFYLSWPQGATVQCE